MRIRRSLLNCRRLLTGIALFTSICALAFSVRFAAAGVEIDRMLQQAGQRYGEAGTASVMAWRDLLSKAGGQPDAAKLRQVNDFFNRRIRFGEDIDIWGKPDFWATPL